MEDRNYILDKMKGRVMTVDEFNYDRLWAPPLYSLLSPGDIDQLHKIATSIRYSGKPVEKMKAIDDIMKSRGFRRFGGGTNRVVYKFLEDDSFIIKVATSEVALGDSPREFINQVDLEPFCAKCFEVSPCGTVGLFERVRPIKSREEFLSVADMVYDLITNILIGESVMDDIGTNDFMNYGVRPGFGVVILDYVYRYKLDGNKLYCNNVLPDGSHCGGVIDYDEGFNRLSCTKCGRVYKAMELRKAIDESMVLEKGGFTKMKVAIKRGDTTEYNDTEKYLDTAPKLVSPKRKGKKSKIGHLTVAVHGRTMVDPDEDDEEEQTHLNVRGTIVHGRADDETNEDDSFGKEVDKLSEDMHKDDDNAYTEEDMEHDVKMDDDSYNGSEDDGLVAEGFIECSGDVVKSSDIDGDEDNSFKAIAIYDDDGNVLGTTDGKYFLISELMGKSLDDLVILDKSAYNSLMDELESTKANLEAAKTQINVLSAKVDNFYEDDGEPDIVAEGVEEDDGLEYYIDEKGVARWKSNHSVYKKPIPEDEAEYDTSSKLIPKQETFEEKLDALEEDMLGDEAPVGAAPPKRKKEAKRPKYESDDDEYFDHNKIKNNNKKSSKRR